MSELPMKWVITVSFMGAAWDWEATNGERTLFCAPDSAPWTRWGAKREAVKRIRELYPRPPKRPIKTYDHKTREYVVWQ